MEVLIIQLKKLEFKNKDAANNLIRYITRTRMNEDRRSELITYGYPFGNYFNKPIEHVIREFEYIQETYGTEGSLMCHYAIQVSPTSCIAIHNDMVRLNEYAKECCNYIFNLGYQCIYAIHYSEKDKLHIHLAINTTSYCTGHKLRQYPKSIKPLIEIPLAQLFKKYEYSYTNFPTYF